MQLSRIGFFHLLTPLCLSTQNKLNRLREENEYLRKRVKRESSGDQEVKTETFNDEEEERKPKIKPVMLNAGLAIDLTEE
jgi:hypothetical protein